MNDELNPAIVRKLDVDNKELYSSIDYILDKDLEKSDKKRFQTLKDKYEKVESEILSISGGKTLAKNFSKRIGSKDIICPIVFRVDVETELVEKDNIQGEKFGGIPDLRSQWDRAFKREGYGKNAKKTQMMTPDEWIEAIWPKCGCCHNYMQFVCQIDLSKIQHELHHLTKISSHNVYHTGSINVSGLGFDNDHNGYGTEIRWQIFNCPCADFEAVSHDTVINRQYLFKARDAWGVEKKQPSSQESWKKRFPNIHYKALVQSFMQHFPSTYNLWGYNYEHQLQNIIKKEINFEPYWPAIKYGDKSWKQEDKLRDKYWTGGGYSFFGNSHSQQDPCAYRSINGHFNWRQMPLLSWSDDSVGTNGGDMTRQVYSCIRSGQRGKLYGKTDASCT